MGCQGLFYRIPLGPYALSYRAAIVISDSDLVMFFDQSHFVHGFRAANEI